MQSQARIDAYLREFRDRKFSDRNLAQAQRFLLEEKCKYALRVKGRNIAFPQVALACVHPQGYIKSLGGSKPDDLILDNFGTVMASWFRAHSTATKTVALTDVTGAALNCYTLSSASIMWGSTSYDIGSQIKIGSSKAAAQRGDYSVTTAFGTSPESGLFDTGTGAYSGGVITVTGSITAGGTGTIQESILSLYIMNTMNAQKNLAIFHDIISPGSSFVAADPITVQYVVNL